MGCNASKEGDVALLGEENEGTNNFVEMLKQEDPAVENSIQKPVPAPTPTNYGSGPASAPNGSSKKGPPPTPTQPTQPPPPPQQQQTQPPKPPAQQQQQPTFNRAKDRVDAIPESKLIDTKDIRLRYAYFSQRGFYPDEPFKANQDSYCVHEAISQYVKDGVPRLDSFFGVFDGHGKDGDGCAQYTRTNLPYQLKLALQQARQKQEGQQVLNRDQIQNALLKAHVETNKGLHKNPQIDDSLSGTTAISVYWHGRRNRLTISNVGDSRAVIGSTAPMNTSLATTTTNHNNNNKNSTHHHHHPPIKAFPLSRDQTPYRKDERARIRATGARILSLDQLEGLEPINDISESGDEMELGEEIDEGGDPPRVWAPSGDYPGTAFTRSIGDAMAEDLGVFAEPEMLTRDLRPEDKIIVLASDGVFEFLTNQSVIDICAKFGDPLEACRAVVAEAYELWLQYELRTDDITIIVIFIDELKFDAQSKNSRRTSLGSLSSSHHTMTGPDMKAIQADVEKQMQQEAEEEEEEEEEESDDEEIEEVVVPESGFKPVRQNVSREKSKELAKLKSKANVNSKQTQEEEVFDLNKLATPKSEEEKRSIAEAIKASVMFRNINEEQRQMIFSCMESVDVKKGTWVIKQGDVGDRFYIIDEGLFEVRILPEGMVDESGEGGNIIHVYEGSRAKRIHPAFGELALMYSAPRTASVVAQSDGHLWALHRSAFRQILIQAQDHRRELKKVLTSIPYFQYLDTDGINKLAAIMDEVTFGRGENIIEQGHPGKIMYVIKSGSCYTVQMVPGETKRGTMRVGNYFGDEVFSSEGGRYDITVVSLQTTSCWQLSLDVVKQNMGPLLQQSTTTDQPASQNGKNGGSGPTKPPQSSSVKSTTEAAAKPTPQQQQQPPNTTNTNKPGPQQQHSSKSVESSSKQSGKRSEGPVRQSSTKQPADPSPKSSSPPSVSKPPPAKMDAGGGGGGAVKSPQPGPKPPAKMDPATAAASLIKSPQPIPKPLAKQASHKSAEAPAKQQQQQKTGEAPTKQPSNSKIQEASSSSSTKQQQQHHHSSSSTTSRQPSKTEVPAKRSQGESSNKDHPNTSVKKTEAPPKSSKAEAPMAKPPNKTETTSKTQPSSKHSSSGSKSAPHK